MPIKRTDHISLNVVNLEEAIHFFRFAVSKYADDGR